MVRQRVNGHIWGDNLGQSSSSSISHEKRQSPSSSASSNNRTSGTDKTSMAAIQIAKAQAFLFSLKVPEPAVLRAQRSRTTTTLRRGAHVSSTVDVCAAKGGYPKGGLQLSDGVRRYGDASSR